MPDEVKSSLPAAATPTPVTVETITTTTTIPATAIAVAATASSFKTFLTKHLLWIKTWVTTHGGFTHVGTVAILGCGFGYTFFPPFTHMFDWIWSILPHWLKEIGLTTAAFYAWIRNPRTKAAWKALVASQTTQHAPDGSLVTTTTTVAQAPPAVAAAIAAELPKPPIAPLPPAPPTV